jgi:hypothetical protein
MDGAFGGNADVPVEPSDQELADLARSAVRLVDPATIPPPSPAPAPRSTIARGQVKARSRPASRCSAVGFAAVLGSHGRVGIPCANALLKPFPQRREVVGQ